MVDFATAHGFTVTHRDAGNRLVVDVSAQVGNVERAFGLHLHHYRRADQSRFFAPDGEPKVDDRVALAHISGLDDAIVPRPASVQLAGLPRPRPGYISPNGSGPGGYYWGYDFRAAYAPGVSLDGRGQKVGLVQFQASYYPADILTYEQRTGLPAVPLENRLLNGYDNAGDPGSLEPPLDIEMAISMAPGLDGVITYNGGSWDDIVNQIASG